MRRTAGRKPMSAIRSASSTTAMLTSCRLTSRLSMRSSSRPGTGHQDVDRGAKGTKLGAVTGTAVDGGDAEVAGFGEGVEHSADLGG